MLNILRTLVADLPLHEDATCPSIRGLLVPKDIAFAARGSFFYFVVNGPTSRKTDCSDIHIKSSLSHTRRHHCSIENEVEVERSGGGAWVTACWGD